jgi:hypothetical protein
MYMPVHPVWLQPSQGENRPLMAGALISGRAVVAGVGGAFCVARRKDGALMKISGPNIDDCDLISFLNESNQKVIDLVMSTIEGKNTQKKTTKKTAKKTAKKAVKAEVKKAIKKVVK